MMLLKKCRSVRTASSDRPAAGTIQEHSLQFSRLAQLDQVARPELAEQFWSQYADVCAHWKSNQQLPIVYHPDYNITLWGIEKLHPFDSCKFDKVVAGLQQHGVIATARQLVQPLPASDELLLTVHSSQYLLQLHSSSLKAAQVTELAPLAMLPHSLVKKKVLDPMRLHVGGTVLAAALAVLHGYAINLGGGMHHAHSTDGAGWCPYADITLAIRKIRAASQGAVQRILVVDLDVHQGNGVERDKLAAGDQDLFILDVYNRNAFPWDQQAKAAINVRVELEQGTSDASYLSALEAALQRAAAEFPQPHLLIYNAGTDILAGDPLGRFNISPAAVVQRDAAVFALAAEQLKCPIVMLLSGGYTKASAGVIVESVVNLMKPQTTAGGTITPG